MSPKAGIVLVATAALAGLGGSFMVPLEHEAIGYNRRDTRDPIAMLNQRIARGETKLKFDQRHGYLPAVLDALKVPRESQVLVFSKTSFQAPRIAPHSPRALYFNDTASIGWVQGGDVVEAAAVDPDIGVIFYTLDQDQVDKPRFVRRDMCLQCHQSSATLGVPGLVVRSVYPEPTGMPAFEQGTYVSDHRSPIGQRWGGWYVNEKSTHKHLGNAVLRGGVMTPIQSGFDPGQYLTPYSDVAALLVLEHQTHMTNLITRVNFEVRYMLYQQRAMNKAFGEPLERRSDTTERVIRKAAEELVDYLLFIDEAPLEAPVEGSSGYAQKFSSSPLRQLDLTKRLQKLPLSFMVETAAFDALPDAARVAVANRLMDVLSGHETDARYKKLTPEDRRAISAYLREHKPRLGL